MCIAVVKPKNVDFPTTQQLKNCFDNNRNGAGFMYSDGEKLIIKKGYMNFNDFIKAFQEENISKDKLVFFHFRIATRGLVDGGNTHPFPLVDDIALMRNTQNNFKGYGLIHNGVFSFPSLAYNEYDKNNIISDTMLMSMKIKKELDNFQKRVLDLSSAIAYHMVSNDEKVKKLIEKEIGYNKVAIMNEKEELFKYGNWIEYNGVFYSNGDYNTKCYDGSGYYSGCGAWNSMDRYDDYGYEFCDSCKGFADCDKVFEASFGLVCEECIKDLKLQKCPKCEVYFQPDELKNGFCEYCVDDDEEEGNITTVLKSVCDTCDKRDYVKNMIFTKSGYMLCQSCYNKNLKSIKNKKLCEMCREQYIDNSSSETICENCIAYLKSFNELK